MRSINSYKNILIGLCSNIPGVYRLLSKTGGTISSRYCYSVWLRHFVMAKRQRLLENSPEVIAELGPGDSLGTGLAALLSGARSYYAFDIVHYTNISRNLEIFEELVELFRNHSAIPDEKEFPHVGPRLLSYAFPGDIITDERLEELLDEGRLNDIRGAIKGIDTKDSDYITYIVPWKSQKKLQEESVDMIISQAVCEHVDDLEHTYQMIYRWLKPGGIFSQEIDFTSHGTAKEWNGHWQYSQFTWKLIRGRRAYLINRQPLTVHRKLLIKAGFNIVTEIPRRDPKVQRREKLAREFQDLTDEDLATYSCFIQSVK